MNFQNIEYFLTVAKYRNFTKAAQSLYISQQSLSENIRRLEEEIGTPLFVRGKTLSLTPAGECFRSGGNKILSTQDKMLREIAVITNTNRSKIVLGSPPMDLPPFLPQALKECSQKYPEYQLSIKHENAPEIADLIFTVDPAEKGMELIPLIENDPFGVVIGHSLAQQTYGKTWHKIREQLEHERNLAPLRELPFLLLYSGSHLQTVLDAVFSQAGFAPKEAFKSEDANLLCSLCAADAGAFIGPRDYCRRKFGPLLDEKTGSLAFYPLNDAYEMTISLTYPSGKHLNQAERRFIDIVRSVILKT